MTISRQLQQLVIERANRRSEYCQLPMNVAWLPFQFDHIISEKLHGPTSVGNLALSCEHCNSHKGPLGAGYLEGKHVRLFHPRQDRWREHFEWNGPMLIGKTDIGRVTIDVLMINQSHRIEVRRTLIDEEIFHPG